MRLQAIQIILESGQVITAITRTIIDENDESEVEFVGFSEPFDVQDDAMVELALSHADENGEVH